MKTQKSFRNIFTVLALSASALFVSGCASITRGGKEDLIVHSTPSDAHVKLSTGQTGTTPVTFKVRRNKDYVVVVEKDGFETVTVNITHQTATSGAVGMAGNIILGGPIGVGVDYMTGATQELIPNPVSVHLRQTRLAPAPKLASTQPVSVTNEG